MLKLGVVVGGPWTFFSEIHAELARHHTTKLFARRIWRLPVFENRTNRYWLRRDLTRLMAENDVVFFEWASDLLAMASHLPKACKIVTRLHRFEMYEWTERINWEAVDRVIVVSRAKQREFGARFPGQAGKVEVLPPSIPLAKFPFRPRPFSGDIGTLCNIAPRKRVYDLLLSFYDLTRRNGGYHLHIGGVSEPAYQDYAEAIRYIIRELGLEKSVTLYGHLNDTWNWYPQVDIFVSNSYSEGLQVAPVEAMASGCYCLSHHWDGAAELLPGENLYYTSSELVDKILQYSDLSPLEQLARRTEARAMVCEKFDVRRTAARIREIVEETAMATHP